MRHYSGKGKRTGTGLDPDERPISFKTFGVVPSRSAPARFSMDVFHFDAYTSYSDASSNPRTPSPRTDPAVPSPANYKLDLDPASPFFPDPMSDDHTTV